MAEMLVSLSHILPRWQRAAAARTQVSIECDACFAQAYKLKASQSRYEG